MTHSLHNAAPREALTDTIMAAKIRHNLTFDALAEGTGLSLAFVTAALLGQHALPEPAARTVAAKLGLDEEAVLLLQTIPLRGGIPGGVPTDPTIYRFYEMLQVYGSTLKALVHEQFGDGIISAINFKLDIKKVADPDGGERAVITTGRQVPADQAFLIGLAPAARAAGKLTANRPLATLTELKRRPGVFHCPRPVCWRL